MSKTSWVTGGTAANNNDVGGTNSWSSTGNAIDGDDGTHATASLVYGTEYTQYLQVTNFGFSIPTGSTINKVSARALTGRYSYGPGKDGYIKLVKGGTPGGNNVADTISWPSYGDTYKEWSGDDYSLWGNTLTAEDVNSSGFGVAISGYADVAVDEWVGFKIYDVQIRIDYTLNGNSERTLWVRGKLDPSYSQEDASSLGADDSTLATEFSTQDYTDVGTDNDTYVDLVGSEQYFQFLFKEYNSDDNSIDNFRITWKGKSTLAPSSYTVYLQIYNRTTTTWTTIASNNTASANTKFTLTYDVTTNLSDYYDANHVISARVYQDIT